MIGHNAAVGAAGKSVLRAFTATHLALLVTALVVDGWVVVLSVVLMTESVLAGTACLVLGLLAAGAIGWRISFRWKQLRSGASNYKFDFPRGPGETG